MSEDTNDRLDSLIRRVEERDLARSRGQKVFEPVVPPVTGPFTGTVEPSEEEFVGSGEARIAPAGISLEQAKRIALGEEKDPGGYVTGRGYVNLKLGNVLTLGERIKRALEQQPFVDEGGNVVGPGGKPLVTDQEFNALGAEVAGYGLGLGTAGKYGVSLTGKVTDFLRQKLRRAPTPVEIKNVITRLQLSAGAPDAVERQVAREKLIERGKAAPPADEPKRVIEAPPPPGKPGTGSRLVRKRILEAQKEAVNDPELIDPAARVVMDPALRDPKTGKIVIEARERIPETGPTRRERITPDKPVASKSQIDEWIRRTDEADAALRHGEKPPPPPPVTTPPTPTTPSKPSTPSPSSSEPYEIIDKAHEGVYTRVYDKARGWYRGVTRPAKSWVGLNSPSNIGKDYPAFGRLVNEMDDARSNIASRTNELSVLHQDLNKTIGVDKTAKLLRLRDEGKPLGVDPDTATKINTFYDLVYDLSDEMLPGQTVFKDGFVKRLKQSEAIQNGKVTSVAEYTTEDLMRLVPAERGKKLRARLAKELKGDEPYTSDNVNRLIRAVARQSVIGSKYKPGFTKAIRPLLDELDSAPDIVKREATSAVNYFLGVPGSRSPQELQRWSDRLRAWQYGSKIAGNVTSPIWNAGQNFLTLAEVDNKSFVKAWGKIIGDWNARLTKNERDPELVSLIKRAGLENDLKSSQVLSDIGLLPGDVMNKFDGTMAWINDKGGIPFRFVERHNRLAAFLSGYEDGIARKMDDKAAIENGKKVMRKTQFPQAEVDLPRLFRSAPGGTVGQFKTFVVKYSEYMTENAADAIKAVVDPHLTMEQRKHNVKKFVKFWGPQITMGGLGVIPGAEFLFGDQLDKLPEPVQHGVGALIGVDLGRQFGIGVLPIEKYQDFLYNVPGPAASAMQDVASLVTGKNKGSGFDFSNYDRELSWDEWERKFIRLLPSGAQTVRLVEAVKAFRNEGVRRNALTPSEAFGLEDASGRKLSEVPSDIIQELIGTREFKRERERDINAKAREEQEIERRARIQASEYYSAGKYDKAQSTLKEASDRLGREIIMSPGNIKIGEEAEFQTALERLRERAAKRGVVIPKL